MAIDKKNIFLTQTAQTIPYSSSAFPPSNHFPQRSVSEHANTLKNKLKSLTQEQVAAIRYRQGLYLEFSGAPKYDLAIKSLENIKEGIRLLNVHQDKENEIIKATVYIPSGKESYFLKKIDEYENEVTKSGKPKNNDLIGSIEDIKSAILESFWIGDIDTIPLKKSEWCEVWLRFDYREHGEKSWKYSEDDITKICQNNNIQIDSKRLIFPERLVKLVFANAAELKLLISFCPFIAEIRRAQEVTSFFDELSNPEQKEWVEELLSRTTYRNDNNVYICLLDTGISSAHQLLQPAIKSSHVQSVISHWGSGDFQGHGTEMAGISLFFDLKNALEKSSSVTVSQGIESVKILSPANGCPPELYGSITEQAVSLAEIANPNAKRVICMAITSSEHNTIDGSPTSWSAAIDNITSGANEDNEKRLFIISAGNVDPLEFKHSPYPGANTLHRIESPGQSWNAITVGAYSNMVTISDPVFKNFSPLAPLYSLSPYSSTSELWNSKWPIKPDVLFSGGNIATDDTEYTSCSDLSLLTTNRTPLIKQFSTIWGTSSAAAQASWFCAQLLNEYPDMWPETVRALMIHSADWTKAMKKQFCKDDTKTKGRRNLLRHCGYGIPNLNKAIQCMDNSVNMIIQGELQPYDKSGMKEMHIHMLPWPKDILKSLGEVPATLKVTLSYFIEPGPAEVGWNDKYRYPSCGLRFEVNNSNQSIEDFKKRINIAMRGEDNTDKGDGTSGSTRWYLGSENRDVGSVHSDFIHVNAIDLCDCNYIAVYPVSGWWKSRRYLGKYDNKIRYSLVVSLSTPKPGVDLYTPILTQIENATEISISTN